jgi:hypothetical protein
MPVATLCDVALTRSRKATKKNFSVIPDLCCTGSGIQGCSIQLYLLGQLNVGTKPDYDYEHEHEHELEQDKISQFGIGTLFWIVFFFFVLSVAWWLGVMPPSHGGTKSQSSLRINLAINYS